MAFPFQKYLLLLFRMKKATIAILAILYITVTSGVSVNLHYCMGQIASVDYGHEDHDVCGKCGMKESIEKKGCCHTEHKLVKVDDAHQLIKANVQLLEMPAVSAVPSIVSHYQLPRQEEHIAYASHAPPDTPDQPAYLLHCVFRI